MMPPPISWDEFVIFAFRFARERGYYRFITELESGLFKYGLDTATNGSIAKLAALLRIQRSTMSEKLKRYSLRPSDRIGPSR